MTFGFVGSSDDKSIFVCTSSCDIEIWRITHCYNNYMYMCVYSLKSKQKETNSMSYYFEMSLYWMTMNVSTALEI